MEPLDLPPLPPPPARSTSPPRLAVGVSLAAVFALVAAIAIAAATGSEKAQPSSPGATTASPSPSTSPAPTGGYGSLYTRSNGEPYLWPTCGSIHYVVNLRGAPANALSDVKEAVDRVSTASRMPWIYDGLVSESPRHRLDLFDVGPGDGDPWPPVLVAWLPHGAFLAALDFGGSGRPGHILGFGLPKRGYSAEDSDHFVSGLVVLDSGQKVPRGFGTRYSRGVVLMHELAHIMGLAHVKEFDALMYAGRKAPPPQKDWGDGDLVGLAAAGRDPSCD